MKTHLLLWILLLPLIGALIAKVAYILIDVFFHDLSLEFFYLTSAWEVFGGIPLYYMGLYGFGANFATNGREGKCAFGAAFHNPDCAALFSVHLRPSIRCLVLKEAIEFPCRGSIYKLKS